MNIQWIRLFIQLTIAQKTKSLKILKVHLWVTAFNCSTSIFGNLCRELKKTSSRQSVIRSFRFTWCQKLNFNHEIGKFRYLSWTVFRASQFQLTTSRTLSDWKKFHWNDINNSKQHGTWEQKRREVKIFSW